MKIINGDLIELAEDGYFDVIVHGCNCFCTMGAGVAKLIKEKFPAAFLEDQKTVSGDKSKLGSISWATVVVGNSNLIIVNGYTQFNWKGRGRKVNCDALRSVFQQVKLNFPGLRIGYPAIGAGLAGGDWEIIAKIIKEELAHEDHTYVKFTK